MAGCTGVFDYSHRTLRKLIGVTCMDLNIVVALKQLQTCNKYTTFLENVKRVSSKCADRKPTPAQIKAYVDRLFPFLNN